MADFTEDQIIRYSRHIVLPQVGGKGQKKIRESKVLLIGAGGLGSPAGYYLAAAGVGKLGIVDQDEVDLSNLQRQILGFDYRAPHSLSTGSENDLSAVGREKNSSLIAHIFWENQDHPISLHSPHHSQANTGVTAGRLHEGGAGFELS
ncbi:molybdopterin-synthase adenylyltransferase, partial [Candidatus Hakubella thermalkaliphila]